MVASRRSSSRLELSSQCRLSITSSSGVAVHSDSNTPMRSSTRRWTSTGTSSTAPGPAPVTVDSPGQVDVLGAGGPGGHGQRVSAGAERPGLVEHACLGAPDGETTVGGGPQQLPNEPLLPMPASPRRMSISPVPPPAASSNRCDSASSLARPTSGVARTPGSAARPDPLTHADGSFTLLPPRTPQPSPEPGPVSTIETRRGLRQLPRSPAHASARPDLGETHGCSGDGQLAGSG